MTRDYAADERRELDEIQGTISDLSLAVAQLLEAEDGTPVFQRQIFPGGGTVENSSFALAPDESMLAWYQQRGRETGYERSEVQHFSLGRVVRGMAGAGWEEADLERRALAEGTNAAGGFLTPEVLSAAVIDRLRNKVRGVPAG